jgi:hypothetical protein
LKIDPTTVQNCFPAVAAQRHHRLRCIGRLALTACGLLQLFGGVNPILSSWLHKAKMFKKYRVCFLILSSLQELRQQKCGCGDFLFTSLYGFA